MPAVSATGSPTADQTDQRPPTQSHSGNTRSGGTPSAAAPAAFAVTAAKWREIPVDLPSADSSQVRARAALSRVSAVVKLFEATMKKVVRGLRPSSAESRSAGSMLAMK